MWSYLSSDWQRSLRLGVLKPPPKRQSPGTCRVPPGLFFRDKVLVYVFHWAALSLVALLVMHVQVSRSPDAPWLHKQPLRLLPEVHGRVETGSMAIASHDPPKLAVRIIFSSPPSP